MIVLKIIVTIFLAITALAVIAGLKETAKATSNVLILGCVGLAQIVAIALIWL